MGPVVVVRWSAAGDIIQAAGPLQALKLAWPQVPQIWVTHARFAALAHGLQSIDEVLPLPHKGGMAPLVQKLRAKAPAAVLDLHGKWRGGQLAWALHKTHRVTVGRRSWRQRLAVGAGLARAQQLRPLALAYHAAVEALVGRRLPPQPMRWQLPASALQGAKTQLAEQLGVAWRARPAVVLSPGAAWATKRWPVPHFAELAKLAVAAGAQVWVTGSPAERPLCLAVAAEQPHVHVLAGNGGWGYLAGILALAQVVVANDSGPMHLARALGVPTVAIFGPTDVEQFDFSQQVAVHRRLGCAPCSFFGGQRCPKGHHRCMQTLAPAQVWPLVAQMMAAGGRRQSAF